MHVFGSDMFPPVLVMLIACRHTSGKYSDYCPANTGHSPEAVSMLAHRLRRWPNIETALSKFPVFAGWLHSSEI